MTSHPTRVLIVKLSSLGDLFYALPAVHNIKVGLEAEIDWVVQQEYADLVKCFSDVRNVISFPRRSFFSEYRPFLQDLRKQRYDLIIDMQGLLKSAFVTRLARGDRRIGPSFCREGSRFMYSAVAGPNRPDRHAVDRIMDVVPFLGLAALPPEFPAAFPVRRVDAEGRKIAVIPASRWKTKNWAPRSFAELLRLLRERETATFFLLGSREDIEACAEIEKTLDGKVENLAGKTSLVETGSILKEMDLVIANDSGPLHMAVALGVPTVSIYGATDRVRTGPYGHRHRVVSADLECRPCLSRECRRGDLACLSGVTPEQVAREAMAVLSGKPDSS